MKLICKSQDLLEAVNTVQKAVPNKSTQRAREGILIECASNLKLTGNNLEIGIEYTILCSVINPGTIIVNARLFGEIVRKLPDGDVCLELENNKLLIDCMKSHFELNEIEFEGFPKISHFETEFEYCLKEASFKDMLKGTIFAIGTDENRKNMTGSLFEISHDDLTMVAIDGNRMAVRRMEAKNEAEPFSVIVPGDALNELIKIMQNDDRDVKIYMSKRMISFEFGNCKFVSRLIEAEFINYKNLISDYHETKIRVNTKKFLASVDRTYFVVMEQKKYPIIMEVTEEKLIITANTGIGHVREEADCEVFGLAQRVAFNPKYFLDVLRNIEDEEIYFYLTSNVYPAFIKPIEGNSFCYLFLPVRTGETDIEQGAENSDH